MRPGHRALERKCTYVPSTADFPEFKRKRRGNSSTGNSIMHCGEPDEQKNHFLFMASKSGSSIHVSGSRLYSGVEILFGRGELHVTYDLMHATFQSPQKEN